MHGNAQKCRKVVQMLYNYFELPTCIISLETYLEV
jgi:hypothetical protein